MFCGKCGTKVNPGEKFCMGCGARLAPVSAPAAQNLQPVPSNPPTVVNNPPPVVNNPQLAIPIPPSPVPAAINRPAQPVSIPPAQTVSQPQVQNRQPAASQQKQDNGQYDWNRVQPRKSPVGGVALIIGLSVLIMGFAFFIWTLAVAVGG